MRRHRGWIVGFFAAIAITVASLHSPGQMSVDSSIALYESVTGRAAGWGPTFFSSTIAWLGGSIIGSSLFIAMNSYLMYGALVCLLTAGAQKGEVPRWQQVVAVILALNPLFMLYAGILWKDVMLTTGAMVAASALLLIVSRSGVRRVIILLGAMLAISSFSLIRQQGILIAAPFGLVAAFLMAKTWRLTLPGRLVVFASSICLMVVASLTLSYLADRTVKPASASPIAVGFTTIRAYDIAGMIANAPQDDEVKWAQASPEVRAEIRKSYSTERIDTIWGNAAIRGYFNGMSPKDSAHIWRAGIKHHPWLYVKHRMLAMSALLGMDDIKGCVPAYWGVAGVPEYLAGLDLREKMDVRDKIFGRLTLSLFDTPVLRNWFYAALLAVSSVIVLLRARGDEKWVSLSVGLSGWLYLGSFLPTSIACDFRYLYPVAGIATVFSIYLLMNIRFFGSRHVAELKPH
jgi:hypothetical protein